MSVFFQKNIPPQASMVDTKKRSVTKVTLPILYIIVFLLVVL